MTSTVSGRLLKRLVIARDWTDHPPGMYPGDWWDAAPTQHRKLEKMGFVTVFIPHNPAHKERVVITEKGRDFLRKQGQ